MPPAIFQTNRAALRMIQSLNLAGMESKHELHVKQLFSKVTRFLLFERPLMVRTTIAAAWSVHASNGNETINQWIKK